MFKSEMDPREQQRRQQIESFARGGPPPTFLVTEEEVLRAIPSTNVQNVKQVFALRSYAIEQLRQTLLNVRSSVDSFKQIQNTSRVGDALDELTDIQKSLLWARDMSSEPGWSMILNVARGASTPQAADQLINAWIAKARYIVGNATEQLFGKVAGDVKTQISEAQAKLAVCEQERMSLSGRVSALDTEIAQSKQLIGTLQGQTLASEGVIAGLTGRLEEAKQRQQQQTLQSLGQRLFPEGKASLPPSQQFQPSQPPQRSEDILNELIILEDEVRTITTAALNNVAGGASMLSDAERQRNETIQRLPTTASNEQRIAAYKVSIARMLGIVDSVINRVTGNSAQIIRNKATEARQRARGLSAVDEGYASPRMSPRASAVSQGSTSPRQSFQPQQQFVPTTFQPVSGGSTSPRQQAQQQQLASSTSPSRVQLEEKVNQQALSYLIDNLIRSANWRDYLRMFVVEDAERQILSKLKDEFDVAQRNQNDPATFDTLANYLAAYLQLARKYYDTRIQLNYDIKNATDQMLSNLTSPTSIVNLTERMRKFEPSLPQPQQFAPSTFSVGQGSTSPRLSPRQQAEQQSFSPSSPQPGAAPSQFQQQQFVPTMMRSQSVPPSASSAIPIIPLVGSAPSSPSAFSTAPLPSSFAQYQPTGQWPQGSIGGAMMSIEEPGQASPSRGAMMTITLPPLNTKNPTLTLTVPENINVGELLNLIKSNYGMNVAAITTDTVSGPTPVQFDMPVKILLNREPKYLTHD